MDLSAGVEKLGLHEKLEDLAGRFGAPHCPEYELSYFQSLRRPEIRAALEAAEASPARGANAADLVRRGRLRRVSGDLGGALEDFQKALDLNPGLAAAHAGLGEARV